MFSPQLEYSAVYTYMQGKNNMDGGDGEARDRRGRGPRHAPLQDKVYTLEEYNGTPK